MFKFAKCTKCGRAELSALSARAELSAAEPQLVEATELPGGLELPDGLETAAAERVKMECQVCGYSSVPQWLNDQARGDTESVKTMMDNDIFLDEKKSDPGKRCILRLHPLLQTLQTCRPCLIVLVSPCSASSASGALRGALLEVQRGAPRPRGPPRSAARGASDDGLRAAQAG